MNISFPERLFFADLIDDEAIAELADLASVGAHTAEIRRLLHFADGAGEDRPVHFVNRIPRRFISGIDGRGTGFVQKGVRVARAIGRVKLRVELL